MRTPERIPAVSQKNKIIRQSNSPVFSVGDRAECLENLAQKENINALTCGKRKFLITKDTVLII
jgi:hypothetical protein